MVSRPPGLVMEDLIGGLACADAALVPQAEAASASTLTMVARLAQ